MNILFLQNRPLFPADTGGKIRTLNILRHLARWHSVVYLCNVPPGEEAHLQEMTALGIRVEAIPREAGSWGSRAFYTRMARNLWSSWPFNVEKHFDPAVHARARALAAAEPFDLMICDFVQTAPYAAGIAGLAKILFQHNVEAQILQRHAKRSRGLRGIYLRLQARRLLRFEQQAGSLFDGVIAVSQPDREWFERNYGWPCVRAIDTGVDVDHFTPGTEPVDPNRVVFVGALDWLANRDGLAWFVQHVWPIIRRERPAATLEVVGRNPTADVLALGAVPGVNVVGTVPDVRPHVRAAALVVVPLLVGGGTRLKIFEAMALGKAVVSTTIGCEGLPVTADSHLLVEDTPNRMAKAVLGLLADPARAAALGQAARALVCQHYDAETVARQFEQHCQAMLARRAAVVPATQS